MILTARSVPALAMLLSLAAALGACQQTPRSRSSQATSAACRQEVDRVYSAQNRVDLSTRDQRDTPFAGSFNAGITSNGLGARYGRDSMESSCLANAAAPAPDATPKPAAR